MTDLEITRLCAEAMRLCPIQKGKQIYSGIAFDNEGDLLRYDPLRDDAQKWKLAEKFPLCLMEAIGRWQVSPWKACDDNLGRNLCECVAKLQAAKKAWEGK